MAEEQVETLQEDVQVQEAQAQAETPPEPQAQAQAEPRDTTDWKAEARKWEARAKQHKAKADAYDAAEEAAKSDLQKAVERAEHAESELAELRAQQARAAEIRAASAKYGVDAETLARMGGDVDDNAAFLKERTPKQPAYPQVNDHGEIRVKAVTKEDIESIKDPAERVAARARHLDLYQ